MAETISGRAYVFDSNPLHLKTLQFIFDGSAEGSFVATFDDGQPPLSEVFSLDGTLHIFTGENGLPAGDRGYWADENTFMLERDGISSGEAYTYAIRFEGKQITLTRSERSHAGGPTLMGTLQNP